VPIYEFVCMECEIRFEELVRNGDGDGLRCTNCGSERLSRLLSVFATNRTSEQASVGRAATVGCCGGSCGCG
jgi:putative FmdB family regulatory protein